MSRILVIDDAKNLKLMITKAFFMEEWITDCASSGEEGIKMFHENSYDIVLLDIRMSGMSGTEALKRIKEKDPSTKVIIITAYPTVKNAVECIKLGAIDYLRKPFTPEKIKSVVKEILLRDEIEQPEDENYSSILAYAKKCITQCKLEEAMDYLRKAVSVNMEQGEAFNLLGYIWEIKEVFDKAHRYYSIAHQMEPANDEYIENIKRTENKNT